MSAVIFILALIVFSRAMLDSENVNQRKTKELIGEAEQIGNLLMTAGQPTDWNTTNVQKIGLRDNNEINMAKAESFKALTYSQTKSIFGITSDYFIGMKRQSGQNIEIDGSYGIGHDGVNATSTSISFDNVDNENLVQLTRITRLGQNIIKMEIYTWK
jgi:hypothetical protein